ncbi:MAG: ABC transporter ATP-binding protein [Minwuia sp.]|uniref:ABC transporter ATP-binding protein n=1 Tax=Minwuia sp. TaxID=2493630 RepID=UPI003A8C2A71
MNVTIQGKDGAGAQTGTPLLDFSGVSRSFGKVRALDDVSLTLRGGEVHCLLGENGAGKSTLCNLAYGLYPPTGGALEIRGKPFQPRSARDALASGVAMVHQHFSLVPTLTVIDNLLLGRSGPVLDRRRARRKITELAGSFGLDIDPDAVVGSMSVGQRQRVEIVKCLINEPDVLILDEPTAVLSPDEIQGFLATVREIAANGRAVLLVTHKLAEVAAAADRATVLRLGCKVAESEEPSADVDGLVRAMIGESLSRLDPAASSTLGIEGAGGGVSRTGETTQVSDRRSALTIDGLTVEGRPGIDRLSLIVRRGETVGVAGVEGNGQRELEWALSGIAPVRRGRFHVGETELTHAKPRAIARAGVAVIPEDRHALACVTEMSLAHNLHLDRLARVSRWGFLDRRRLARSSVDMIERFDIRAGGEGMAFSTLSGGNQQKAVLARELSRENLNFVLASQPTRGLDVGAVAAVYARLREACNAGAGVLLISSELDELLAVADRIVVIYRGRLVGEFPRASADRGRIGALMSGQAA